MIRADQGISVISRTVVIMTQAIINQHLHSQGAIKPLHLAVLWGAVRNTGRWRWSVTPDMSCREVARTTDSRVCRIALSSILGVLQHDALLVIAVVPVLDHLTLGRLLFADSLTIIKSLLCELKEEHIGCIFVIAAGAQLLPVELCLCWLDLDERH